MTRWLVAPLFCALTIPSAAWARQPDAPPSVQPAETEAPAPATEAEPAATAVTADPEAQAEPTQPSQPTQPTQPEDPFESTPSPAPAPPPPVVTPSPAPAPTGPELDSRAEPLLAAGLSTFAGVYLLTAYVGAATIDKAREIGRSDWGDSDGEMTRNRGRALLIPVAGPFIAMHFTNSARRKYWQAVNGGLQVGSLAMAVIGARMYAKHRRAERRTQVTASASPEGAQLGMSMRF